MLSDACFEVAQVLNVAGVQPSAVEHALNAFGDVLNACGQTGGYDPEILAALRLGSAAVTRGAPSPKTLAEMAVAVQRHLDLPGTLTDAELVRALDKWNQTARAHVRPLRSEKYTSHAGHFIRIQDVIDVLAQRGGSVYPHALKTGPANQFPSATPDGVNAAYERALASYALTITPMGKVSLVPPRD